MLPQISLGDTTEVSYWYTLLPLPKSMLQHYLMYSPSLFDGNPHHYLIKFYRYVIISSKQNEALCKGCGVCVAACPSGAITDRHFTTKQLMAEIEGVLV